MQEFIETFHIDWKLMIAQLFNFGIVFLAFYLLAAKPLRKLMKERGETISKGVNDAKVNAEILEKTQKASEEILSKARIESNKIFQEGKKEGEKARTEMIENGKKETALVLEKGRKELQVEKAKIIEEVKKEIIPLAMLAAEKVMAEKNK
jgi:F-type H+-transporting ATPase subunit b